MTHSFHALIVEIDVRDLDFRRQTLSTYRKAVIV